MAKKTPHTHTGTCQACGRQQACDYITKWLAKHGYTVDFGWFQGTCPGSGLPPAEIHTGFTVEVISRCNKQAEWHESRVALLEVGSALPLTFDRWNRNKIKVNKGRRHGSTYETKGDYDTLPIAEATKEEREKAVREDISLSQFQANSLRNHATFLRTVVLPRLGMPLTPVERARTYVKGMQLIVKDGPTTARITLTQPAYNRFGNCLVGWMATVENRDPNREFRYTTRELNAGKIVEAKK